MERITYVLIDSTVIKMYILLILIQIADSHKYSISSHKFGMRYYRVNGCYLIKD